MNDRTEELLGKYLDGDIQDREAEELLEIVKKSPSTFHRLRQLVQLDERLRHVTAGDPGGELLARAVLERLQSSEHGTEFALRVVKQLPTRPALTTRRAHVPPRPAGWIWFAGSAAAALLFVVLVVFASRPEARRQVAVKKVSPEIPTPEEVAPPAVPEAVVPRASDPAVPVPEPAPRPGAPPPIPPTVAREPDAPKPAPLPPKSEPDPTVVAVAPPGVRFEDVEGDVYAVTVAATAPAKSGLVLPMGAGVDVRGSASLVFPDGTRLELRSGTRVDEVTPGNAEGAKSLVLRGGALTAAVIPQPAKRPFKIQTSHGHVDVLGTFLKVGADAAATRVEVWDGRVQVVKSDGTSALVRAGQGALVSPSAPIAIQPLPPPKAGSPFTSFWLPENRHSRWRATVDGRAKAILISSAVAEPETGASVWASGTWNLVLGNLQGAMEIVPDAKTADEESKRHDVLLRVIEGRDAQPDQWIEIVLTPSGTVEARVNGKERTLASVSVKDILKARHSLLLEFEVTQSALRLTAGGRTIFSGPHLLGGYGIVRVSLSGQVREGGGTSADKILNPHLLYVPAAGK